MELHALDGVLQRSLELRSSVDVEVCQRVNPVYNHLDSVKCYEILGIVRYLFQLYVCATIITSVFVFT